MKKVVIILMGGLLLWGGLMAQDQVQRHDRDRIQRKEYLMCRDGKMFQMGTQEKMLQNQFRLQNGILISPDGSYQLKNGKHLQLKNGECLDMNGKKFANQERIQRRLEQHDKMQIRKNNGNARPMGPSEMKGNQRQGRGGRGPS